MRTQQYFLRNLLTTTVFLASISSSLAQQSISGSFTSNGNNRTYIGAVPDEQETPLRLVIMFCGAVEDAAQMQLRGFNDHLGNGTMVVYPEPYYFMGSFQTDSVADDFLMVEDLITHITSNYPVDVNDICVGGFSSGGAFSYDLVCEFNSTTSTRQYRIKAFAVVSGVMEAHELNLDYCPVVDEVPLIAIHGTADATVNYEGDTMEFSFDTLYFPSTESTIDFWAQTINGCNADPIVTPLPDLIVEPQVPTTVERIEYDCPSCINTEFYRVIGGLHTWPTSDAAGDNLYGGHNQDIVASQLIAEFFECSNALTVSEERIDLSPISIYPNPVRDVLSIRTDDAVRKIEVFDVTGQMVLSRSWVTSSLSMESLPKGTYFLRIETDAGQVMKKVIKD